MNLKFIKKKSFLKKGIFLKFKLINIIFISKKDFKGTNQMNVAFLVYKKLFKKAVERNKIKRFLKNAYYENIKNFCLKEKKKYYILFIYKNKQIVSYKEIKLKINKIFKTIFNI